jgi:hypothetical protein
MTTTAPPPEAKALATETTAIVISQFDVLLGDIKEAKAKAADATFDYNTKEGNKAARSYIFDKRKLNARIESARTDAKAYALAYGRTVDSQAAELKGEVAALIKPHQEAIDAIAKAEADRVQRHRDVLQQIRDLAQVPFGSGANQIAMDLVGAKGLDLDGLEEFKEEAAAALLETIRTLEVAHTKALADEAAAAELAQLREQQRIQKEKEAEDARIKAQQEAIAEAARKAQEEADAAALLAIQEAEQKTADAEARAAAAEALLRSADPALDMLRSHALRPIAPARAEEVVLCVPAKEQAYPAELEHGTFVVMVDPVGTDARRDLLYKQILDNIKGMDRGDVAAAIVNGHLHPAITINWGAVQ